MKTKAAIVYKAGQPLIIENVDLEGPREGEVLVEIKATGICHTDEFTRSGADPEGIFPAIILQNTQSSFFSCLSFFSIFTK